MTLMSQIAHDMLLNDNFSATDLAGTQMTMNGMKLLQHVAARDTEDEHIHILARSSKDVDVIDYSMLSVEVALEEVLAVIKAKTAKP